MLEAERKKREEMLKDLSQFFDMLYRNPMENNVEELIVVVDSIIPVHVDLDLSSFDEVDKLLSLYPFIYQKLVRLFAIYMHIVRRHGREKTPDATKARDYRDAMEELLKVVKLQYEALSRRITVLQERRA